MTKAYTTESNKFTMAAFIILTISLFCAAVKADVTQPGQTAKPPAAKPQITAKSDQFAGYDFEQVVDRLEKSVDPLQKEMSGSLKAFAESVERAEKLADEGKSAEAVELCHKAIGQVLNRRDAVLEPMWEGQLYLSDQAARVRERLAKAVEAGADQPKQQAKLDKRTETMLDGIARRIATEQDATRKKRLIAHYRTIRQLARIKSIQQQLSPNQRKLWRNVLRVLEDTALAHQQVLMGTEVLFSQFEATAMNLQEYRQLLQTFEGVNRLTGAAKNLDSKSSGLGNLSESMGELQSRLGNFNKQIEQVLKDQMGDLEQQVNTITSAGEDGSSAVMSAEIDNELVERISKIQGDK